MFGVIAIVSEKLGGKSWEELIIEKIYTPTGMGSSSFISNPDIDDLDIVSPYKTYQDSLRPVDWYTLR